MNLQSACCADEYCSLGTNSDDGQPKCGTPANTHFPLIDGLLIASFVLLQSNVTKTVIRVNVKISRDALSWQTAPCNATMQASLETPRALWLMVTPADVSAVAACLLFQRPSVCLSGSDYLPVDLHEGAGRVQWPHQERVQSIQHVQSQEKLDAWCFVCFECHSPGIVGKFTGELF